ncbi:MAG: hypothetical protein ACR2JG_07790 [Geodermatophilaceae bacterium]
MTAGRVSDNRHDFALVTTLGLLGLRIFEATGTDVTDLGENKALPRRDRPRPRPPPRRPYPQPPLDALAWLHEADQRLHTAQAELTAAAQRAHTHGHSWAAIGTELKITRQAAQQRFQQDRSGRG